MKAGLDAPGVRLRAYDLRHTAATLLLEAEEHPKVVQEILGRAITAMTLDTYSHVSPELTERALSKLSALVRSGQGRRLQAVR